MTTPLTWPESLEADEQLKQDFTDRVAKCKTRLEFMTVFDSLGDTMIVFGGELHPASDLRVLVCVTLDGKRANATTRNYGLRRKAMELAGTYGEEQIEWFNRSGF